MDSLVNENLNFQSISEKRLELIVGGKKSRSYRACYSGGYYIGKTAKMIVEVGLPINNCNSISTAKKVTVFNIVTFLIVKNTKYDTK